MSDLRETESEKLALNWIIVSVGNLVEQNILEKPLDGNHGEIHPKGTDFVSSGIPFVMATDINNGKVDLVNCKFITEAQAKSLNKGFSVSGDVLLTHKASLGRTAIVGKINSPYILLTPQVTYYRIKNKQKLNNQYLKYYFDSPFFQDTLVNHGDSGSTRAYVGITAQRDLPVCLPHIEEQKAIAAVLSSLDDKIDLLHRQNQTLEAMAETLFRQWFIVEAQEDWENTTLEQHTEVFRGISYKGSGLTTFGLGKPMHNLNSVFEGGGYKNTGIKYYSGDFKERHIVNAGDIIVTNTEQGHDFRLIGYPAIVPKYFGENGLFSQHIYRLVPKLISYLTTEYLYYLLMTPVVREQVTSATNGSTVNMLAIDGLQRPEFKLPPKEKIVGFTEAVKSCWKKNEINQNQIRTLETLRDTLLPKLMNGEVRVHFDEETA